LFLVAIHPSYCLDGFILQKKNKAYSYPEYL